MQQNYNKKNAILALLGQGKWKHALKFTLLLIGFVLGLGGMKTYAQEYEGGKLQMSKQFHPTKDDNSEGELWLETYVTGAHITHSVAVPSDIVLVLDMSTSMTDNFGTTGSTKVAALQSSVASFLNSIYANDIEDAGQNGKIGHRVSIVAFSGRPGTSGTSSSYCTLYSYGTGTLPTYANSNTDASCRQSLREITTLTNGNKTINSILATNAVNRIISDNCHQGTYAQYGLNLAWRILNSRQEKTYIDDENKVHPRGASVVFFTDGYVGGANTPNNFYIPRSDPDATNSNSQYANQAYEADAAAYQANRIKNLTVTAGDDTKSPVIYAVGIFTGADPHAAYATEYHPGNGQGQDVYNSRYSGYYENADIAANGLMHMISSDYPYETGWETAPAWNEVGYFRSKTTSNLNVAERFFQPDPVTGEARTSKFFDASDQSGLNAIFTAIASEAGTPPMEMTEEAIVQDVISSSFTLPPHEGGGYDVDDIEVYAVKCVSAVVDEETGNVSSCTFENGTVAEGYDPYGYGTRTSRNENTILYLDLINHPGHDDNGAVNEQTANGKENRLRSSDVVEITTVDGNPQIQITGFNFKAMYCGLEGEDVPRGRKLVIKISIRVKEGSWGDNFITNGPMSYVTPDGGTTVFPFEVPIIDVIGSVWTEKVTTRPTTFKVKDGDGVVVTNIDEYEDGDGEGLTAEIGTPEELAWFISEVNGRIHYPENNNVASHPKLSAVLTADIDMSAHNWVPIGTGYLCNNQDQYLKADGITVNYQLDPETGEIMTDPTGKAITLPAVNLAYEGTFDGNGHVITGLKNNVAKYYKVVEGYDYNVVVFPGMFSNVTGTVKNVFVLDADFHARNHYGERETFEHFGIIADTLTGGTIFNCEAVGRITCDVDTETVYTNPDTHEVLETQLQRDSQIILGGLVGYNNGGTIHSSMAMPVLTGYTMGGMIGENKGLFSNGFTNGVYNYLDNKINDVQIVKPVGGIAATNTSSISNCYVRFSRQSSNLDKATFGQVVGSGSFTEASCFTPRYSDTEEYVLDRLDYTAWNNTIPKLGASTNKYSNTRNPGHMRGDRSNDNMVGGTWHEEVVTDSEGEVQGSMYVLIGGTPLLNKLNNGRGAGASWKRTTAGSYSNSPNGGDINGDYPVLVYDGYTCLAGNNGGIGVDYATSLDEMLTRHNNYTLNVNSNHSVTNAGVTTFPYKDTQVAVLKGGAINLFANESTTMGTSSEAGTVVYIDENVSLLQSDDAPAMEAYTGQTLIDYGSNYEIQSGNRWHNVSSSLQNSMTGLTYTIDDPNVIVPSALGDDWAGFKAAYDAANNYDLLPNNPCRVKAEQNNDDAALFPADMRQWKPFDFYTFFEPEYHWVNFKRKGNSHWHMDSPLTPIDYYYVLNGTTTHDNETQLIPGKGYLLALHFEYFANWHMWNDGQNSQGQNNPSTKDRTFLQNRGTLNNGTISIPVTANAPEWTGLKGYNLLGNPYQSYLDFDEFVAENASLWGDEPYARTYAVIVPEIGKNTYLQYTPGASGDAAAAGQYLNMHQGFFIRVSQADENTVATFTNDMRTNEPTAGTHLRGGQVNYPLVNLFLTDSDNNTDVAVLEVGRPENGGGEKLRVGSATGRISLRHDDTDFGILFRDMTEGSQPLRFETQEDGTFTLSWNTANANFSSLTLVDNITGVNYDMLAHDSYEFEGRASDYKSRFKILIGEFTDVEENEETVTNNFAFFDGSEWVVNGKGQLTVTDVMGRTVYTGNLTNDQNRVSLNGLSQGVYLMQVHGANGTMVQKIVVK